VLSGIKTPKLFSTREPAPRLPEDSPLTINAANPDLHAPKPWCNIPLPGQIVFRLPDLSAPQPTERGLRQPTSTVPGDQDKQDKMKGGYIPSLKVVEPSDYTILDEGAKDYDDSRAPTINRLVPPPTITRFINRLCELQFLCM